MRKKVLVQVIKASNSLHTHDLKKVSDELDFLLDVLELQPKAKDSLIKLKHQIDLRIPQIKIG